MNLEVKILDSDMSVLTKSWNPLKHRYLLEKHFREITQGDRP